LLRIATKIKFMLIKQQTIDLHHELALVPALKKCLQAQKSELTYFCQNDDA
jgi:hypothetical protein